MNLNEKELEDLCEKFNCTYHITATQIIIKTKCASWRFDYTAKPYKLYHRPIILQYYNCTINNDDGFHNQNKSFNTIEDLMEYIYTHDKDYFRKPKLPLHKKKQHHP